MSKLSKALMWYEWKRPHLDNSVVKVKFTHPNSFLFVWFSSQPFLEIWVFLEEALSLFLRIQTNARYCDLKGMLDLDQTKAPVVCKDRYKINAL